MPFRRISCLALALSGVLTGLFPGSAKADESNDVQSSRQPIDVESVRVPVRLLLADSNALATWLGRRNPDLMAARARVEQAEAGIHQSRVIPNPTLSLGISASPSPAPAGPGGPDVSVADTINYSIGLSETVELGKRGPRARAAVLRRDAARAATSDVLADRLANARDALARIVYLAERGHVLEERLRSARHVAELEHVRLEHGDISGIDQDRLELDAAAVARGLADNQVDLQSAVADCSALLVGSCWPMDAAMDSIDSAAPTPETFASLDALIRARPDVRATLLASSAAKSDAVYYRRHAIPDPTFGVAYTRDYYALAGNQPYMLTATASVPLPFFDHGQHLARTAEGQATELSMQARALETRAAADARSLLVRRNVLRDKLETLSKLAIPRADEVLRSSEDAYHHGQLSLTDLLLVRREHASLLLDALDTRYELFLVRNTLYRTLGLGVLESAAASSSN
jgi:cobalt-zinc-cadmium efflux system outer membrane protein